MCNDKRWQSLRKVLSLVEKELRIFHCLGNASAQPILFTALDFGPGTLLLFDILPRSETFSLIRRNRKEFVLLEFYHVSKISLIPTKTQGKQWTKFAKVLRNHFFFQSTEWGMSKQCVKTPYRQFVQVPLGCNRGYSDRSSLELTNFLVKCSFMTFTNVFEVTRQLIGLFWMHEGTVDIHGFVRCFGTLICYKCVPSWLNLRNHSTAWAEVIIRVKWILVVSGMF